MINRSRLPRASAVATALLVLATSPALAQDKATLDLLVKKNVITQEEANNLAKSTATPAIVAGPKEANVKGLKIEGLIQSQFDWLSVSDKSTVAGATNPPATEQFEIRRTRLGAQADLGNGWNGEIEFDFAIGSKLAGGYQGASLITPQLNFEKITMGKKLDDWNGALTTGYRKVNFTLEEYTLSTVVKPIERSILSNYFDGNYKGAKNQRIGFASHHAGVYWDGKVGDTGFLYGAAVTNGIQSSNSYGSIGGLNRLAGWSYLGYNGTLGTDVLYAIGVNFGYSQDGNSIATQANSVWGYNPYLSLTYNKQFQFDAEFIQTTVTNGRGSGAAGSASRAASPFGFNLTPSYKLNDQWEIVARYTYLFTDGRGTNISDVVNNAPDVTSVASPGITPLFNDAQSFYVGLNWNVVGDSVKLLFGYEWDEFSNRNTTASALPTADNLHGPRAVVSGFRARAQLQF